LLASNISINTHDKFQGKSQAVRDLYSLLLENLNKIGPIRETQKEAAVSLENRKAFASAIIRDHSIKLILRTGHKIASPRVLSVEHVGPKSFDHTILLLSERDIDHELVKWLGDAYRTSM
jgi:hypothetical protein